MGLEPKLPFVHQPAYVQQSAMWMVTMTRSRLCWRFKASIIKGPEPKANITTKVGIEPATFRLPFGRLGKQGPDWGLGCYNKVPSSSCTGPFLNNRVRSRIEPRPFRDLRANGWVPLTLQIYENATPVIERLLAYFCAPKT